MRGFRKTGKWLRLPSRIGLLAGIGALSAAGARADVPTAVPASHAPDFGELSIRAEAERIYVSEGGQEFREFDLGDTADAHRLRELLAGTEGAAIPLPAMILAGSGGEGFHWTAPSGTESTAKPAERRRGNAKRPATGSSPDPHSSGKANGARRGGSG
jgi:hypothetical protein